MPVRESKTDRPTSRDIEMLFKELKTLKGKWQFETKETEQLEELRDKLKVEMDKNPELVRLRKVCKQQKDAYDREYDAYFKRLGDVRKRYLANGPTEQVVKMIRELVEVNIALVNKYGDD